MVEDSGGSPKNVLHLALGRGQSRSTYVHRGGGDALHRDSTYRLPGRLTRFCHPPKTQRSRSRRAVSGTVITELAGNFTTGGSATSWGRSTAGFRRSLRGPERRPAARHSRQRYLLAELPWDRPVHQRPASYEHDLRDLGGSTPRRSGEHLEPPRFLCLQHGPCALPVILSASSTTPAIRWRCRFPAGGVPPFCRAHFRPNGGMT